MRACIFISIRKRDVYKRQILAGVMEMFARMGVATLLVPAIGYTGACFASPAAWICADLFLIPASCWSIAHLRRVYGQPGERSGSPAP